MDNARVAIVTGGAQGIGREVVETLLRRGLRVASASLGAADAAPPAIPEARDSYLPIETDVSKNEEIAACVERVFSAWGRIDILVNNAGIRTQTAAERMTREEWDRVLAVNLGGSFFFAQAVLPEMEKRRWGRIVMMASIAGQQGSLASSIAYSASKAGQLALAKQLAKQYAACGITVNAVAPAAIETPELERMPQEERARLERAIPVGRFGKASEVAELVGFLVSENAGYVTGATFDLNGGLMMR
ncbi:SDR family NAD(P)-dependent oxidoreductase [Cohnella massiliensis]|uniref:SDR family NAD(P)-dependent oxidoreductase n=1 Tax=Cohnella massiliensis TaxID=1816691 RepID=UPI001593207F|nr:SDR family NAD(P)-dependent oxidoreductase [Cohnella massiliensis]